MINGTIQPAPGQVWADMDKRFGIGREVFILAPTETSRGSTKGKPAFSCAVFKDGRYTGKVTVINADRFRPITTGYSLARFVTPDELDVGIRDVVQWLWSRGFATLDSGDGSKHPVMECALPYHNVFIASHPNVLMDETRRLQLQLAGIGITVVAQNDDSCPSINAAYDPVNERAVIMLIGVTSEMIQAVSPANMRQADIEKSK